MAARLAHAVCRAGTVMSLEGGERPVRVGQHVDAALGGDQDGDIGRVRRFRSSFRRFQDRLGVIEKSSHSELIGTGEQVFGENRLFVAQSFVGINARGAQSGNETG